LAILASTPYDDLVVATIIRQLDKPGCLIISIYDNAMRLAGAFFSDLDVKERFAISVVDRE